MVAIGRTGLLIVWVGRVGGGDELKDFGDQ